MTTSTLPRTAEPTPESQRLARLDADIAALKAKRKDPQGWEEQIEAELQRLSVQRELLRLAATTILAA